MKNLQLLDTENGGTLVFDRYNYQIDGGLYTELYCAMFSTKSPTWLGGGAFNVEGYNVSSQTQNALSTYNSNSTQDINLIKKAVENDMNRVSRKNPDIVVKDIALQVYSNSSIRILIEIEGNSDTYNFLYAKTAQSLENLSKLAYKTY